jgi:hypothetical protein
MTNPAQIGIVLAVFVAGAGIAALIFWLRVRGDAH